jgi:hypothetical protein
MSDYYFDDPIDETPAPRRRVTPVLASIMLLIATTFFFKTTLASNITLTSSGPVEFGQGITLATACSGSSALTVTPVATFSNSSGGGAHYFSSVTVSGIPSSCNGVDFNISAYGDTGNALALFNTTSTVASVWDNGNSFQGGKGWLGSTITSGSGSFTVSFTSPVALASNVAKLTLQSINHLAGNCITENICSVGDTGPGGGIVFYVSAAFTETGTVCNTKCNYLELAPKFWFSNPEPVGTLTPTSASSLPSTTSSAFGSGWSNTNYLSSYSNSGTGVYAAVRYGAATSTVGQWFLPSANELGVLWNSPISTQLTFDFYWSSTYLGAFAGTEYCFPKGEPGCGGTGTYNGGYFGNPHSVRPIRAF